MEITKSFQGCEYKFICSNAVDKRRVFTLYGELEYTEILIEKSTNKIVYDIGAAIGITSILISKTAYQVTAFEPDKTHFDRLVKNISLNHLENKIKPEKIAIGNFQGTTVLHTDHRTNGVCPSLYKYKHSKSEVVEITTLGHLPKADIIKIDVEGAELDVLDGMPKNKYPEYLFIEFHPLMLKLDNKKPEHDCLKDYEQIWTHNRAGELLTVWKKLSM